MYFYENLYVKKVPRLAVLLDLIKKKKIPFLYISIRKIEPYLQMTVLMRSTFLFP